MRLAQEHMVIKKYKNGYFKNGILHTTGINWPCDQLRQETRRLLTIQAKGNGALEKPSNRNRGDSLIVALSWRLAHHERGNTKQSPATAGDKTG